MSLGIKSFATEGVHDKVHNEVHDKVPDKVPDKVHDKVSDKVHDWYQSLGTKIFGEPVLGDGGTTLSAAIN